MSPRDSKVSVDEYKKLVDTGLEDDRYIINVAASAAEANIWDWRMIVIKEEDDDSTLKALSVYMSDSQYEKAELAISQYGISP